MTHPIPSDQRNVVLLRARWVAPMDGALLEDAAVVIADGTIRAVGDARTLALAHPHAEPSDAGEAVILPGLVNAHTHLELSQLVRRPLPSTGFVGWILELREQLMRVAGSDWHRDAASRGISSSQSFGVTCVGDVTLNANATRRCFRELRMHGVSCGEILGMAGRAAQFDRLLAAAAFREFDDAGIRIGLEPHAPYSLDLVGYRRCVEAAARDGLPIMTHLAETPDEAEFLAEHTGPFRQLWDALGGWSDGVTRFEGGPIRAMQHVGLLDLPAVLAHVNYCDDAELELLSRSRASVVYCPRTHAYFKHAPHRWRDMLARGINVAVGTDSCASSPDLNLVDDLRLLRSIAPDIDPAALWEMATLRGARALGMDRELGSLTPGKWADMVVFPASSRDPLAEILDGDPLPSQVWVGAQRLV